MEHTIWVIYFCSQASLSSISRAEKLLSPQRSQCCWCYGFILLWMGGMAKLKNASHWHRLFSVQNRVSSASPMYMWENTVTQLQRFRSTCFIFDVIGKKVYLEGTKFEDLTFHLDYFGESCSLILLISIPSHCKSIKLLLCTPTNLWVDIICFVDSQLH